MTMPSRTSMDGPQQFGDGALARWASVVYQVLLIELHLLLAAAPGIALLVALVADPSNLPLAALALIPFGPALSAALYAWRAYRAERNLEPTRAFWRGYRANAKDVLRWWIPALVAAGVVAVNLTGLDAVAVPAAVRGAILAVEVTLLVVLALWTTNMLVATSFFALRTRDAARLSIFYLGRLPRVTVGAFAVLVVAIGTVLFTSDWVLAGLGSLFAFALLYNARPLIADLEENFTA
ncbi:DUF624 domain-containing protein [Pengzhenrongella sicca]|uniref:DUF624 domain-containing protein n=1 Tax=Pengzhenrongella sicca TaxID=2819238 RepID=A0A8A4ZFX9_9MICO|nr:DUF624 domain-containing protein [Pengzhenrongella sicca]QTE29387.1 DUF624 domain-containing protein [Pengzhenrongella sicca]